MFKKTTNGITEHGKNSLHLLAQKKLIEIVELIDS